MYIFVKRSDCTIILNTYCIKGIGACTYVIKDLVTNFIESRN